MAAQYKTPLETVMMCGSTSELIRTEATCRHGRLRDGRLCRRRAMLTTRIEAERDARPAWQDGGRMVASGHTGGNGVTSAMVDRLLAAARRRFVRLEPLAAASMIEQGAVLVDVRTSEQRRDNGEIPGAVAVPLNVLEWRADVTSPSHDPALGRTETPLVVLCAEGYCSSLAAVRLLELGRQATDVVGGFAAWRSAGLPVERRMSPT
jgi:rhodanese-related sulfurtransferase